MSNLITAEQAKKLLSKASYGPWYLHEELGDHFVVNEDGEVLGWGDQLRVMIECGHHEHDGNLIAAAPTLARTVIAQDARIKELEAQLGEQA